MSTAVAPSTSATPAAAPVFYRPELDSLRFFAFFGVFIFHAFPHYLSFYDANGVPRWMAAVLIPILTSGAYGVDLFFGLSAYLITGLLLRERSVTGRLDLRGFYLRRILRIWPLYLTFVAFAAAAAWTKIAPPLGWRYIAGYAFLAGNWSYVAYGLPASFTIPLWTVSIEEQFYLTWPLAVRRATPRVMALIACGILVAASTVRIWLSFSGASLDAMEYNTFTRLDPIALGVLISLWESRRGSLPSWRSPQRALLLAAGAAGWIAAAAFNVHNNPERPETWRLAVTHPVIAMASAAVLLAFVGSPMRLLRNRVLIYLGKISYGLYVIHLFGLFCAGRLIHPSTIWGVVWQALAGLILTILLAAASYRWLEGPFLRLKERLAHVESRSC